MRSAHLALESGKQLKQVYSYQYINNVYSLPAGHIIIKKL